MVCIPVGALHQFVTCWGRTFTEKFTNSIKPKYGNHHKHLMNRKETDLLETTLTDDKL